jgi:hypothetical protein
MTPGFRSRKGMVIREYFQLLIPCLIVTLLVVSLIFWTRLSNLAKGWQKIMLLAFTALITLAPYNGLSLADYILSLNPNFSIGSLALMVALLWPKFTGKLLLSTKNLGIFCLWNILFSLILFSSYLNLLPYDLYSSGYSFSPWFVVMALITLALIWCGNPLSVIFLAYIAAFNLNLLPSPNFFDYITDGFLLVLSLALFIMIILGRRSQGAETTAPIR